MTGIFEIEPLKVRGQFCLLAFKMYCQDKGFALQDFGKNLFKDETIDLFELIDLMYFGCMAYSQLNSTKFDYSRAKFVNDFENVEAEVIGACVEKVLEVKLFGKNLLEPEVNSNKPSKKK